MGVHFIDGAAVDVVLDPTHPEALVYEVRPNGRLKLVAVEYVVPLAASNQPPQVLGQELHPHSFLPFWVLHAWIWAPHPDDVFEDFNPRVGDCPD